MSCGEIALVADTSINYNTTSDRRMKQNIKDLVNCLEIVMKLKPRSYKYKNDPFRSNIGFIAQEVAEAVPVWDDGEKLGTDEPVGKLYRLDYARLTPLLVGAVKELVARVEYLENRL